MNFKFWMTIALIPVLIQCTNNNTKVEQKFEPLDSIAFNQTLIDLGEKLFFDPRLSINNTVSCASCHHPDKAFTDGKKRSIGIHQRVGKRNAPSLWNVKNQDLMMWDGGVRSIEHQAIVPLQDTNEMGVSINDLFPKLAEIQYYDSLAKLLYDRSFDPFVLTRALSAFQRNIYQENSEYDEWKNKDVLKDSALLRGYSLFNEKLNCAQCHSGSNFTNNSMQNKGLYVEYEDLGRFNITLDSADIGKFKVPTLRNVGITAPYMHDGSFESLYEVIMHYEKGGKSNPNKSELIQPFVLTNQEREDLLYFLNALTDQRYVN